MDKEEVKERVFLFRRTTQRREKGQTNRKERARDKNQKEMKKKKTRVVMNHQRRDIKRATLAVWRIKKKTKKTMMKSASLERESSTKMSQGHRTNPDCKTHLKMM